MPAFDELAARSNLTNAQLLIWLGQALNPDSPLYNMAMRFDIRGPLDIGRFDEAFASVVRDSDTLRSVIEIDDRVPRQVVRDSIDAPCEIVDYREQLDGPEVCDSEIRERTQRVLDVARQGFESVLFRLADDHHVWFFNQHHLFTDILSIQLIFSEVSARYGNGLDAAGDLHPFEAFRARERAEASRQVDAPEATGVPAHERTSLYRRQPAARSTVASRIERAPERATLERLHALAGDKPFAALTRNLGLFNLVATAYVAWLSRVSERDVVTIGCPVQKRTDSALRRTIGLFVEFYPLEISIDEFDTFRTLHRKVSRQTLAHLQSATRERSRAETMRGQNVVLNYTTAAFGTFAKEPCDTRWIHNGHIDPQHDLRLQVLDLAGDGALSICMDINRGTMSEEQGESAMSDFLTFLDGVLEDTGRRIAEVGLVAGDRRSRLVRRFQRAPAHPDVSSMAGGVLTVLDAFRRQVSNAAESLAVSDGDDRLTYAELDAASERLAHLVRSRGADPRLVGICAARSTDLVVAILAILKSGAGFVPLEPDHPTGRLIDICQRSNVDLLLCEADQESRFEGLGVNRLVIGNDPGDTRATPATHLVPPSPDDEAYVMFTSGSTGAPKGVVVRHRDLYAYVEWAGRQYCSSPETYDDATRIAPSSSVAGDFALYSSIGFDLTITSLFVPLSIGGCIRVYAKPRESAEPEILQVVDDDAVDVLKLTPAHLSLLSIAGRKCSRIRTLILGGDDLTTALAENARQVFGKDVRVFNEYGPTEAVVGCMIHEYDPARDTGASVPIGLPADDVNIYLLDEGGNPVPDGVTGEIHVGGDRLAAGYLRQGELTAERFPPDPFRAVGRMYRTGDLAWVNERGRIVYGGRRDNQVKIRGVRIEIAEVAAAVARHPGVSDCHVDVLSNRARTDAAPLRYCTVCGLASNYPGASFDAQGKCNHCRDFEHFRDAARGYFRTMPELEALLGELCAGKSGKYDCMMLLSGGKDSTYALYRLAEMNVSILAMTLDNGYISQGAKANIRRTVADLGIDHEFATTDSMASIFRDSLERHASVCYGCFKTIYTLAINRAHALGIPVIVTGLSRGQLFETRLTRQVFEQSRFDPEAIDRDVLEARKIYHRVPDRVTECLDSSLVQSDATFERIRFVDFYRYCDVPMSDVYAFLERNAPWTRPKDTGRSTNCLINDTGIYVHKAKAGYHNYALPYSWDVRLGHKRRDGALEELNDRIDVARVREILDEIGYHDPDLFNEGESRKLVAYYTGDAPIAGGELRRYLASLLPDAMVPAFFVHLPELPLNANGKVDRGALPDPRRQRPDTGHTPVAPSTGTEKLLAAIWRDTLRLDQVGIHDNFFDLGGDSINAIQIVVRAGQSGVSITPNQLFTHQTIFELARIAATSGDDDAKRDDGDDSPFALLGDDDALDKLSSLLGSRDTGD